MSTKAKVKIFTGIAVLLAIVVAAVAYCGRERQIPTDIGCFPHIKRICVGGEYFTFDEDTRRGEAPAEGEILGTISSVQETHARLIEDGSANFDELLGQQSAVPWDKEKSLKETHQGFLSFTSSHNKRAFLSEGSFVVTGK